MEDELTALILAGRYERTRERLDHRNGSDRRILVTELGATELDVPRRRPVPYRPSFLARAARRTSLVDGLLREAFLRGLSTRETARLAERPTGVPLSASAISRLGRALDARVAAFHRRPIAFAARYLLCDGLWVSIRDRAGRATKRVILETDRGRHVGQGLGRSPSGQPRRSGRGSQETCPGRRGGPTVRRSASLFTSPHVEATGAASSPSSRPPPSPASYVATRDWPRGGASPRYPRIRPRPK